MSPSEPKPGTIAVRDAAGRDMAEIARIYAHYVQTHLATFEEVPPDVAEMTARRARVVAAGLPYLVAETDGAVVGYAYAGLYHARAAYRYTLEDSIYVADDVRGRGVGRALLHALIARCENGPWRQMLASSATAATRARSRCIARSGSKILARRSQSDSSSADGSTS